MPAGRSLRPDRSGGYLRFLLPLSLSLFLLGSAPQKTAASLHFGENHSSARWIETLSEHFRVIHTEESRPLAERTLHIAENAWQGVTSLTGGTPPDRIDIVLRDFSDRSSGLAYVTWPRIDIEPYSLDRDVASIDFLRQVVIHEFTHIAMFYAVGGGRVGWLRRSLAMENLPDWWVEGLASALEKRVSDPREEDLVRMAAADGELPRIRRQDDINQGDLLDLRLVYRAGESKIRWIAERFGTEVFAKIHQTMRPFPWSFNHALKKVIGMGEEELDRLWRDDVTACYGLREEIDRPERGEIALGRIERPLAAAWSSRGDLALAAVRDEDRWWTELSVASAMSPAHFKTIEEDPVTRDFHWSPTGASLVYAKFVTAESNARTVDLFRYDADSGKTVRLTRGRRARSPVWLYDASMIVAIGYEPSDGSSHLLFVSPEGGVNDRIPAPPDVRTILDLAPSPDSLQIAFVGLTFNDERELFLYDIPTRLVRPLTENGESEFEPAWIRGDVITVLRYRAGSPEWAELPVNGDPGREVHQSTFRQVYDVVGAPGGGFYQVASTGRYGASLSPLEPPDLDGNRVSPPSWNSVELIPLPADQPPADREKIVSRHYHAWRSIRFRADPAVRSVTTDRIALVVDDLLAESLDLHLISVEGDFRYDGQESGGSATYRNRAFFPTIQFTGGYRDYNGEDAPWRDITRSGEFQLGFPVAGSSVSSRLEAAFGLVHEDVSRTASDTTDLSFRRSDLTVALDWNCSRPRDFRRLALAWRRGIDWGNATIVAERVTGQIVLQKALIRNDWFLALSASATAETGAEKVTLATAPSGISRPSHSEVGTTIANFGVDLSFPLSEDLRLAWGPFYFERLTHRMRYREGRAWMESRENGTVRSASTMLDLTLFSGHFIPFAGTETATLTAGYARELTGEKREEWFFGLQSSLFSDRWTSSDRR